MPGARHIIGDVYAYAANDPINGSDPNGHVFETPWDVANVVYDVGKITVGVGYGVIYDDYSIAAEGVVDLGVDVASTLAPGVPAGGSKAARIAAKYGDEVVEGITKYGDDAVKLNTKRAPRSKAELLEANKKTVGTVGVDKAAGKRTFSSEAKKKMDENATGPDGKMRREYCGQEMTTAHGNPNSWQYDHYHPWSKGGPSELYNGRAACRTCNLSKGKRLFKEWSRSRRNRQDR